MSTKPTTGEKMIHRFMIMLKMLYSGQGLSTNELCKEFGISLRTLQRDIPRLQDYCDIELEKGKDGNYYISRGEHEDGSLSFGLLMLDSSYVVLLAKSCLSCSLIAKSLMTA